MLNLPKTAILAFLAGTIFGLIVSCYYCDLNTKIEVIKTISHCTINQKASYIADDKEAQSLLKQVRVLCWVMTQPKNHEVAAYIKRTWGSRCNKLIFFSTENDTELGVLALDNVKEGRDWLWAKTRKAFAYIYKNHLNDAEWFLKADDDTYVIMENLRFYLNSYDSKFPLYFGCRLKTPSATVFGSQGYMSGGAGYVLSKEALARLVEKSLMNARYCSLDHDGAEDVEIGQCLANVGVELIDTRDHLGRYRFHPFAYFNHVDLYLDEKSSWYRNSIYYPQEKGLNCCSDSAISFHYIKPRDMYALEYLIYHLKAYGISYSYRQQIQENTTKRIILK